MNSQELLVVLRMLRLDRNVRIPSVTLWGELLQQAPMLPQMTLFACDYASFCMFHIFSTYWFGPAVK